MCSSKRTVLAGVAAGAALLSACAGTPETSSRALDEGRAQHDDCFFASTLRDWRPLDNENLILFAMGRRPYHVVLQRPAIGLRYDISIGVYDRDGRICAYGGDAVIVDGPMPERIAIRSIRRLSDEQLGEVYQQFGIEPPRVVHVEERDSDEGE